MYGIEKINAANKDEQYVNSKVVNIILTTSMLRILLFSKVCKEIGLQSGIDLD